jgi:hypothetical protein
MRFFESIKHSPRYIRLSHWEYWSFNTVYYPILFYWFYVSFRAKSFFFFNAANPSIAFGGFLMESKWEIAKILPAKYSPYTQIVRKDDTPETLLTLAESFHFPIICKPDMGSRGRGVAVIHNTEELLSYQEQCPLDFLMQEKIDHHMEAGIFYVRIPGEKKGKITGIVEKEFLSVTGDGYSSIKELVLRNDRFLLQLRQLETFLGKELDAVLLAGEKKLLVPFGNHARGCRFIDSSNRINAQLTTAIDEICQAVPEFYFGRMDIRFESWEKLERLEQFSIIELNGAGSEPTHMYDERNSILDGWKEILKHHRLLYEVSVANHKSGHRYLTVAEGKKMFADNKEIDKKMDDFVFKAPASTNTLATVS